MQIADFLSKKKIPIHQICVIYYFMDTKTGYEIMKSIKSNAKCENELRTYIIKKENEGKSKKAAKIVGLNKFLRMYYGKVKKKYRKLNIWQIY